MNNSIINLSYFYQIGNNNSEFLFDMIKILINQLPEYQELMLKYYDEKEWQKLGGIAHKSKSSISMLGMESLVKELKKIELDAKDEKNIEYFPQIISKFVKESNLAISELNEFLAKNNK